MNDETLYFGRISRPAFWRPRGRRRPDPSRTVFKIPCCFKCLHVSGRRHACGRRCDPTKDGNARAAAYWDLSGDIDTSKPLLPSNITPSSGKTLFYGATALKDKKSLWFTVQPYIGALYGCGEGRDTGATKKYLEKLYGE